MLIELGDIPGRGGRFNLRHEGGPLGGEVWCARPRVGVLDELPKGVVLNLPRLVVLIPKKVLSQMLVEVLCKMPYFFLFLIEVMF